MKITHLTSAHRADDVRIFQKECRSLAKAGYRVSVVGPYPEDSVIDGIPIRAVKRGTNRLGRFTGTVMAVFRGALAEHADAYHFHDPDLLPVGLALRAIGKRVVYDAHEDYGAAMLDRFWLPAPLRRAVSLLVRGTEQVGARVFNAVSAATPTIAELFPQEKTHLVQNFPFPDEFAPVGELRPQAERPLAVGFGGGVSVIRNAAEMIDAAAAAEVRLGLAGPVPADLLQSLKARPSWAAVDYRGNLDRASLARFYQEVRAGLVLYKPLANHVAAQPTKLFEYMAAGLPVICSDFPLWRQLVVDNGCGLAVDQDDVGAIAQAIRWVMEHPTEADEMGRRGIAAVRERLNWEGEVPSLLALYRQVFGAAQ